MLLNAQRLPPKQNADYLILLAIQDITHLKRVEKQVKENEDRFRLLIQNSFDIISVFDESGTIKYISHAIEPVLGYTREERLGKNIFLKPDTHPDDVRLREDMFIKSLKNPGKNIRAEFRMQHKNGTYRTMDAVYLNLLDDSRVQGVIANYRDITERKMLEQQKDDFIGIASHELKTPVTSIKAYAQILHEKFLKQGDNASAEMIYKLHSQIDRLTMLIGDLLDFTHIEGDKLKFRNEEYDLNKLILQSVEELQRVTKKHKLETVLDKSRKMYGDRFRTGEVISNLLSNAIKYSPDANRIIITSKVDDDMVTISIRDFGIGIDEKLQHKVFDRFYRISDPSISTFPGLGLGLYIAAGIVKKQGGQIWVKSKKGEGSEFSFSLPTKSKIQ
jgi:PAS domain S-box-containing protein